MEEISNPFQEETADLLSLDTKEISSPDGASRISTHFSNGNATFESRLKSLQQEDTAR